jgi:hypothetical protein
MRKAIERILEVLTAKTTRKNDRVVSCGTLSLFGNIDLVVSVVRFDHVLSSPNGIPDQEIEHFRRVHRAT